MERERSRVHLSASRGQPLAVWWQPVLTWDGFGGLDLHLGVEDVPEIRDKTKPLIQIVVSPQKRKNSVVQVHERAYDLFILLEKGGGSKGK